MKSPSNNMFDTADQVEDFLTSSNLSNPNLINIWNNLQESFDNETERVNFFNRVAAKQIVDRK
jgi:hypothetical protein